MATELLDAELVKKLATEKGLKLNWISKQVGISKHSGYVMFRDGLLPKDPKKKEKILKDLAAVLGTNSSALRMRVARV